MVTYAEILKGYCSCLVQNRLTTIQSHISNARQLLMNVCIDGSEWETLFLHLLHLIIKLINYLIHQVMLLTGQKAIISIMNLNRLARPARSATYNQVFITFEGSPVPKEHLVGINPQQLPVFWGHPHPHPIANVFPNFAPNVAHNIPPQNRLKITITQKAVEPSSFVEVGQAVRHGDNLPFPQNNNPHNEAQLRTSRSCPSCCGCWGNDQKP